MSQRDDEDIGKYQEIALKNQKLLSLEKEVEETKQKN